MVWLLRGSELARVSLLLLLLLLTNLIGLVGFNHVITGSTKVMFLVVSGSEIWSSYAFRFFLPTLLGNIVEGV